MITRLHIIIPTLLIFILIFNGKNLQAQDAIASQGAYYSNGGVQLSFTLGEVVTKSFSSPSVDLGQGFQNSSLEGPNSILKLEPNVVVTQPLDKDQIDSEAINIYPNPIINNVFVELPELDENAQVILYNIQGKELGFFALNGINNQLDLSDYAPGLYFLKIHRGTFQSAKTFQVVKL